MGDKSIRSIVALFPVVLVFYGVFLTQYVQEDAFIYFRTALNFAENGDYSFNEGSGYPAATSVIYSLIISFLIKIFCNFFILALQILNTTASLIGAYFLASSLNKSFRDTYEKIFLFFSSYFPHH